jgi:hypothetical protein
MDEVRARRLKNIGYDLRCSKCKEPIVIGDRVMHKRKRIYHIQCWNNIWMDIPDELSPEEAFYVEYGYYASTISTTITSSTISPIPSSTIPMK